MFVYALGSIILCIHSVCVCVIIVSVHVRWCGGWCVCAYGGVVIVHAYGVPMCVYIGWGGGMLWCVGVCIWILLHVR